MPFVQTPRSENALACADREKAVKERGIRMEKYYKELYLSNEWDKLMKAKEQGKLVVLCLPLDRYEWVPTIEDFPYAVRDVQNVEDGQLEHIRRRMLGIPYEIFRTERCIVREVCADDIDRLFEIYADPDIHRYIRDIYDSAEKEITYMHKYIRYRYDEYHYGVWIIEDIRSHEVIGKAGLNYKKTGPSPEISYLICRERQHRGLAYEVCRAIVQYAKEPLNLPAIYARVNEGNAASLGLIRKLGFNETGIAGHDRDGAQIIRFALNLRTRP